MLHIGALWKLHTIVAFSFKNFVNLKIKLHISVNVHTFLFGFLGFRAFVYNTLIFTILLEWLIWIHRNLLRYPCNAACSRTVWTKRKCNLYTTRVTNWFSVPIGQFRYYQQLVMWSRNLYMNDCVHFSLRRTCFIESSFVLAVNEVLSTILSKLQNRLGNGALTQFRLYYWSCVRHLIPLIINFCY